MKHSKRVFFSWLLLAGCLAGGTVQASRETALAAARQGDVSRQLAASETVLSANGQQQFAKQNTKQISKASTKKKEKKGWHTKASGKKYYVKPNGKRAVGWTKIKKKYYYFKENGILYDKPGWMSKNGARYYLRKDGSRYSAGMFRIDGKYYYFGKAGKLATDRRGATWKGKTYNIDEKGVVTPVSALEAQCSKVTKAFIARHTNDTMTREQKLRACFNYLLGCMRYRPMVANWSEFRVKEWYYQKAINLFQSPTLSGNCYSFACGVAACAKELGYRPTVVVITADHGFVIIDGKYYDNMYGGLFASEKSSHPGYTVYVQAEF